MSNTKLTATVILVVAAILLSALLIAGCSSTGNSDKSANAAGAQNMTNANTVKNPALKEEVSLLNREMAVRNLTEADTMKIVALSKDPVEIFYAKEFAWLVLHNDSDHYNHPLTFLD